MANNNVDGWVTVFTTGTPYESELVRDRLGDAGLDAVILTHRDRAFGLNVGKMSTIRILVPPHQAADAAGILNSPVISEEELIKAALSSNPIVDKTSDAK